MSFGDYRVDATNDGKFWVNKVTFLHDADTKLESLVQLARGVDYNTAVLAIMTDCACRNPNFPMRPEESAKLGIVLREMSQKR